MTSPRLAVCSCLLAWAFLTQPCFAEPIDPAAARELLKQGYNLKKEGKYADALARLVESLRLDSQLKTLVNIADCEEMLGQLTQAQKHWILARDQASLQGDQTLHAEAEKRLSALEARMPRLTINVAGPKPEGLEVRRNNVLLGAVALGTPLPADPGQHSVVVSAPGHQDARFEVSLAEKDSKTIEVRPGPPLSASSEAPATAAAPAGPSSSPLVQSEGSAGPADAGNRFWNGQRIAAVGAAGLGVVGFAVAGWSWSQAGAKHDDALALCETSCGRDAQSKQEEAVSSAKLSTAMLIAGGVLVAGGAVLWLTAPSPKSSSTFGLSPGVSHEAVALMASGTF